MSDYPDFTVIARLKGEYGGAEKGVSVDVDGHLSSLLYGTYGGGNKKILVDVDGNVRMNLYAQDLEHMVNRFKYGAPDFTEYSGIPGGGDWIQLIDVDGMGFIHMAHFRTDGAAAGNNGDTPRASLDGVFGAQHDYLTLNRWSADRIGDFFFVLVTYSIVSFDYAMTCLHGYTFESNCSLDYYRAVAADNVNCHLFYALV